jgi:hypothetical protein
MFKRMTQEVSPPGLAQYSTLPWSISYALQYRDATLRSKEIRPLFKTNIANLGFYLLMKATDDDDVLQADLLRQAYKSRFQYDRIPPGTLDAALAHLDEQDPPQVNGAKLAIVSRAGFSNWTDRFATTLQDSVKEDDSLFMVANSPYVGFHEVAQHSLLRMKRLGVMKPSRFERPELPAGFLLEPQGVDLNVLPLPHDFGRPENAVVFDDVLHRGNVRQQVFDYWTRDGADQPCFVTAVTVPST